MQCSHSKANWGRAATATTLACSLHAVVTLPPSGRQSHSLLLLYEVFDACCAVWSPPPPPPLQPDRLNGVLCPPNHPHITSHLCVPVARYAAIGLFTLDCRNACTRTLGPKKSPIKVVLLQLGAKPKVTLLNARESPFYSIYGCSPSRAHQQLAVSHDAVALCRSSAPKRCRAFIPPPGAVARIASMLAAGR